MNSIVVEYYLHARHLNTPRTHRRAKQKGGVRKSLGDQPHSHYFHTRHHVCVGHCGDVYYRRAKALYQFNHTDAWLFPVGAIVADDKEGVDAT